jgi:hypothetical protein
MKRTLSVVILLTAACSAPGVEDGESVEQLGEELNGELSPSGFLVKKSLFESNEALRQQDTAGYYASIGTASNGTGSSISSALNTLAKFRSFYQFAGEEEVTYYYNRGDLGLGREMHCTDRWGTDGQIACYVTNYAAGDDGTEFTFGLSPEIAFDNMAAGNDVATVAMVYRDKAQAGKDKLFFAVYDGAGNLANAAPLDRHGLNYANEFARTGAPDPALFGTPGVNFNNHIPSNCLSCHGGTYQGSQPRVQGAFFLPFDLDQFEFKQESGYEREHQQTAFMNMNEMVRRVAYRSTNDVDHPVVRQIDGWYDNFAHRSEALLTDFDSSYVPDGWDDTASDITAYQTVVRPSCRGCHITSPFSFESSAQFGALASLIATDLGSHSMPHALQTQRLFWQSGQVNALETYFRAIGQHAAADALYSADPDLVVTLDPPLILSVF